MKKNNNCQLKKKKDKFKELDVISSDIADFNINDVYNIKTDETNEANKFRWSLGISNIQKYQYGNDVDQYFILVAVSRIDVNKEMKGHKDNSDNCDNSKQYQERLKKFMVNSSRPNNDSPVNVQPGMLKKGTAIYRLKLKEGSIMEATYNERGASSDDVLEMACHYSDKVSGICRFIEDLDKESEKMLLKRF